MWSGARRAGVLMAGAALASGCTAIGHHARPEPAADGGQDRLVFQGDAPDVAPRSGVASFAIRNVDAGPIVISSARGRLRLDCPASTMLRVRVGDGSRQLIVRQVNGAVLLRAPVRESGQFYVLARTFGALIGRVPPETIGPASYGCGR